MNKETTTSSRTRSKGLWIIKRHYYNEDNKVELLKTAKIESRNKKGDAVTTQPLVFAVNPSSVTITPIQRVGILDTAGGTAITAWHSGNRVHSGIGRIEITVSGSSNIYIQKFPGEVSKKLPTGIGALREFFTKLTNEQIPNVFGDIGRFLGLSNVEQGRLISVADNEAKKLEEIRKNENLRGKRNLLELFSIVNSEFVRTEPGTRIKQRAIWELIIKTPVLSSESDGNEVKAWGYITKPMSIIEDAARPFRPSWSFTFTIFDEDVKTFLQQIQRLERGLDIVVR